MPTIRAAVCHRFNGPLVIEYAHLRTPVSVALIAAGLRRFAPRRRLDD